MRKLGLMAVAAAMTVGSLFAGDGIKLNKMLTLTGHVDMSYRMINRDEPAGSVSSTDTSTFAVDETEVDFLFDFGHGLSARADLAGGATSADATAWEQAFINYDFSNGFSLTMGKFDSFIGLEGAEATDLFQASNSLSADLNPAQHTGLCGSYKTDMFNLAGAIVNGLSAQNPDINDSLAFAIHAGITPSAAWAINLNYAIGDEGAGVGASETTAAQERDTKLLSADVQYANYNWTVGAEYTTLDQEDGLGATKADTKAWMLMVNYAFSERFALTGRYSTSEDKTAAANVGSTISEFTISPSYAFTPNWSGLLELRFEDADVTNGTGVNGGLGATAQDATIFTLETTLSF